MKKQNHSQRFIGSSSRPAGGFSLVVMLCCMLFAAGCATVGRNFPDNYVKDIKIGTTTQENIRTLFGSPWRVGLDDGRRTWTYGLYHYSLFGEESTKDLVIRFDNKGVVVSYTYNTTEHRE